MRSVLICMTSLLILGIGAINSEAVQPDQAFLQSQFHPNACGDAVVTTKQFVGGLLPGVWKKGKGDKWLYTITQTDEITDAKTTLIFQFGKEDGVTKILRILQNGSEMGYPTILNTSTKVCHDVANKLKQ